MSELHVFAHFGEAQSFIEGLQAKRTTNPAGLDLFSNASEYILITGEGEHAAVLALTATIVAFPEINQVLNWGVAGSLDLSVQAGEIYSVRTVYGQKFEDTFQYHSFTLDASVGTKDLITAVNRVFTPELARHLGRVAPLVDMELWGLCSVAKRFSRPIQSFKIVSDKAGQPACEMVRDNARLWSDRLWDHFNENFRNQAAEIEAEANEKLYEHLYMTQSQKMRLHKLVSIYRLRHTDVSIADLSIFKEDKKIKPKARTNKAIEWFENELQPIRKMLLKNIDSDLQALRRAGLEFSFDRTLEDPTLQVQISAKTSEEFKEKLAKLQSFEFSKFSDHLSGVDLEL